MSTLHTQLKSVLFEVHSDRCHTMLDTVVEAIWLTTDPGKATIL
jgi:hypothetical protein